MIEDLARRIRERSVILFAGAGLSVSLGLPTWQQLTHEMAKQLGYDPEVLIRPSTSYLTMAEFYRLEMSSIGPLRSWMDRNWAVSEDSLRNSKVFNQIVDLDFSFIYTTNYDRNIEEIHRIRGKKFFKIASVKDISRTTGSETQIVKFHGDFDDDKSIVLTESDYYERLNFESPLDIKFRSDTLGRSILFVGYSLSDINIRLILYKMKQMWKESGVMEHKPPLYMFMLRPDPVQERVLDSWGIRTIISEEPSAAEALPALFDQLKQLTI
ncbi:SIR2 family protein [Caulobacter sp. X]|uniref:SIR2 family protein n=1 Tax=Caulobacter sp. X TaxID=2048901 RepID=UPI000C15AE14|nr:SIR2 family protein [Caulobacter sp. X]PIC01737.1 Sir2 family NAD-dependent protein deacetylase [Caulobacter sp. X]